MATPSLATVGGQEYPVGYAGGIALIGGSPPEIEACTNENATAVDFGAAVCRGTAVVPGGVRAGRPAFNPGVVIGFAKRSLSEANTVVSAGTINYPQYTTFDLVRDGYMWVVAAENATEGDAAVIVVATPATVGSATGGAANGTTRLASGAVWQQTVTAAAIGLIRIKNAA